MPRCRRLQLIEGPPERLLPDGNPSRLLDLKLIRDLADLIERGMPMDGASDYYGVPQVTLNYWLRRGKVFIAGDGQPPEDRIFAILVQAIQQAMAKYREVRLQFLHEPSLDAKSRAIELRILERRDRKSWGRREPAGGVDEMPEVSDTFL